MTSLTGSLLSLAATTLNTVPAIIGYGTQAANLIGQLRGQSNPINYIDPETVDHVNVIVRAAQRCMGIPSSSQLSPSVPTDAGQLSGWIKSVQPILADFQKWISDNVATPHLRLQLAGCYRFDSEIKNQSESVVVMDQAATASLAATYPGVSQDAITLGNALSIIRIAFPLRNIETLNEEAQTSDAISQNAESMEVNKYYSDVIAQAFYALAPGKAIAPYNASVPFQIPNWEWDENNSDFTGQIGALSGALLTGAVSSGTGLVSSVYSAPQAVYIFGFNTVAITPYNVNLLSNQAQTLDFTHPQSGLWKLGATYATPSLTGQTIYDELNALTSVGLNTPKSNLWSWYIPVIFESWIDGTNPLTSLLGRSPGASDYAEVMCCVVYKTVTPSTQYRLTASMIYNANSLVGWVKKTQILVPLNGVDWNSIFAGVVIGTTTGVQSTFTVNTQGVVVRCNIGTPIAYFQSGNTIPSSSVSYFKMVGTTPIQYTLSDPSTTYLQLMGTVYENDIDDPVASVGKMWNENVGMWGNVVNSIMLQIAAYCNAQNPVVPIDKKYQTATGINTITFAGFVPIQRWMYDTSQMATLSNAMKAQVIRMILMDVLRYAKSLRKSTDINEFFSNVVNVA